MQARAERRRLKLQRRDVELALLDFGGSGPLALLHHANGFCGALWEPVAQRLATRYRVVAFDARGHGDSTAPPATIDYLWSEFADDLLALVEELVREGTAERVAYGIGHSFGGTLMAVCAARRPELFDRLGLVDPVLIPPPETFASFAFNEPGPSLVEKTRVRRAVWASRDAVRAAWSRAEHPFSSWQPRALELYVEEGFRDRPDGQVELKCSPDVEAAVYENNRSLDSFAHAPRVASPTLLLHASRGNFPRPLYDAFAARMPDARVEEIDAGHLLPMEAPTPTAAALLRFGSLPSAPRR